MMHSLCVIADAQEAPLHERLSCFSCQETALSLTCSYRATLELKCSHVGVLSLYQFGHPESQETPDSCFSHSDDCSAAFGYVVCYHYTIE